MFDFNFLAEFSRAYCIGICAFLIPANLVTTSLTITFTLLRYPAVQVWQVAGIASIFALLMILHVFTWFMIGVVMAPTYILLGLGSICLFVNLGAILRRRHFFVQSYENKSVSKPPASMPAYVAANSITIRRQTI